MLVTEILDDDGVRRALSQQFRAGVDKAVEGYADSAAEEDALTGALGQALRGEGTVILADGSLVGWKTRYRKLRGRGRGAPEKQYGADGLFEVELDDGQSVRSRKSLPFQAKNDIGAYGDGRLRRQAEKIATFPGGGIVVNYRAEGYVAIDAAIVARGEATRGAEIPLSHALGGDFLGCRVGSLAFLFEPTLGRFVFVADRILLLQPWFPRHRIRTTIRLG